jgi:Mg-chelatase subunit ChlD
LAVVLLACARSGRAEEAADPTDPGPLARLAPWVLHEDWSMRSLAAFDLRLRTEPGVVALATRALAGHRHPYADAVLLHALEGRGRSELVEEGGAALVEALLVRVDDAHPRVRARARAVLVLLPTLRVPADGEHLRAWWARGRHAYETEQARLVADRARAEREAQKARDAAAAGPDAPVAGNSVAPTTFDDRFYEYMARARRDGLELCIVLDHTGSMTRVIGAAKAQARRLVERLRGYIPGFRAGLVTYDDGPWLRLPLTTDATAVEKAFGRVGASGGGDYEEGVDQGVYMALRQEQMGWSQKAQRVIVIIGDAPPHEGDVERLLHRLHVARADPMYEHPVIVHTVSTADVEVPWFPTIARAGGGVHVELRSTGRLVEELVALTFGAGDRARLAAWMDVIDTLREEGSAPGR